MVRGRKNAAVFYPETDDMGEHEIQRLITELLRPMLARVLAARGLNVHVGADQFCYWVEGDIEQSIAPDIYVLPDVAQDLVIGSWKVFETGIAPSFALEIAAHKFVKDYDEAPKKYDAMGVDELIIFDPFTKPGSRSRRVRWQIYRRSRAGFERVLVSQSERVYSEHLDLWLRMIQVGKWCRLRIAEGPDGETLVPTVEEIALAERRAKNEERRAKNEERRAKNEERRAKNEALRGKDQALARVAELEAEMTKLRAALKKKRPR